MGLSDVWNEIRFFFIDVSNYSNAEQSLDKYTKIVEELDKKIAACETALETAGDRRDYAAISMDYWQTEVDTEESNLRDELWNRKEEAKESTE